MTEYTIKINETQLELIREALAKLEYEYDFDDNSDADVLGNLIDMASDVVGQELDNPGTVHCWCL